jgi:hypothetical protein
MTAQPDSLPIQAGDAIDGARRRTTPSNYTRTRAAIKLIAKSCIELHQRLCSLCQQVGNLIKSNSIWNMGPLANYPRDNYRPHLMRVPFGLPSGQIVRSLKSASLTFALTKFASFRLVLPK